MDIYAICSLMDVASVSEVRRVGCWQRVALCRAVSRNLAMLRSRRRAVARAVHPAVRGRRKAAFGPSFEEFACSQQPGPAQTGLPLLDTITTTGMRMPTRQAKRMRMLLRLQAVPIRPVTPSCHRAASAEPALSR